MLINLSCKRDSDFKSRGYVFGTNFCEILENVRCARNQIVETKRYRKIPDIPNRLFGKLYVSQILKDDVEMLSQGRCNVSDLASTAYANDI